MIPKTATISYFVARELDQTLKGSALHKVEYLKSTKTFRFLFSGEKKYHLQFSFAPPQFMLRNEWPDKADAFAVWLEATPATIEAITGDKGNRIITIRLVRDQESVNLEKRSIVLELFGALSNAFLLTPSGTILQALRVISDKRQLRPRGQYVAPEPRAAVDGRAEDVIYQDSRRQYTLYSNGEDYRVIDGNGLPIKESAPLLSVFQSLDELDQTEKQVEELRRIWQSRIVREMGRLRQLEEKLTTELAGCAAAPQFSRWGDLLMGNPRAVPDDDGVRVTDYYSGDEVTVKLLPGKTVIETATAYYKTAKKLQRSEPMLRERLARNNDKIKSLQAVHDTLGKFSSIAEIELATKDLVVESPAKTKIAKETESSRFFHAFRSSAGEKILVGKNADGNDELTFRVARTYDLWFHTQQSPGSHVVLVLPDKNRQPSKQSIEEAARVAAFYSDMRRATQVPVIFTERRYVRKVRKGAPGQVTYQNVKSIFVDPAPPPERAGED